jgi:hypothetical protein
MLFATLFHCHVESSMHTAVYYSYITSKHCGLLSEVSASELLPSSVTAVAQILRQNFYALSLIYTDKYNTAPCVLCCTYWYTLKIVIHTHTTG